MWVIISTCRSQSGADVGLLEGRTRDGARVCAGPQRAQEGHTALTQVVWCLIFGYTAVRENGHCQIPRLNTAQHLRTNTTHEPALHHAQTTNRSLCVSASPSPSTGTADLQPRNRSTGISAPACIQHTHCISTAFFPWTTKPVILNWDLHIINKLPFVMIGQYLKIWNLRVQKKT